MTLLPSSVTLFPYTTLFRSSGDWDQVTDVSLDNPLFSPVKGIIYRKRKIGRAHSELQSRGHLVCRLLLEKKKKIINTFTLTKQESQNMTVSYLQCRRHKTTP